MLRVSDKRFFNLSSTLPIGVYVKNIIFLGKPEGLAAATYEYHYCAIRINVVIKVGITPEPGLLSLCGIWIWSFPLSVGSNRHSALCLSGTLSGVCECSGMDLRRKRVALATRGMSVFYAVQVGYPRVILGILYSAFAYD